MQEESQNTLMRKDIFPTPMAVKIYFSSSKSDNIFNQIESIRIRHGKDKMCEESLFKINKIKRVNHKKL